MAAHSSSSTPPIGDVYGSSNLGGHGEEFARLLAIGLFSRAAIGNRHFKLGIEVTSARKFDDVAFYDESADEWWLFQCKHTLESEGVQHGVEHNSTKELTWEGMFPDEMDGTFSMVKYLKCYRDIKQDQQYKGVKVRPFLFTNRKLQDSIATNPASVDDMVKFSEGKHLTMNDIRATNYLNYAEVCCSLVEFFNKPNDSVINELEKYPKLMKKVLTKQGEHVKLEGSFLESNIEFHNMLKLAFGKKPNDLSKLSVKAPANLPNFWSDSATINDQQLIEVTSNDSPFVDDGTVKEFCEVLVLSVAQPNAPKLEEEIKADWCRWMKSWIRPDVFRRLTADQLTEPFNTVKKYYRDWEKPHINLSSRQFLTHNESAECLELVKSNLNSYVKLYGRQGYVGLDAAEKYYVNRRITLGERYKSSMSMSDEEFVEWLCEDWTNHRCIALFAEPGMGKSTLWQHLAFQTQRKHADVEVFLIYLNDLKDELQSVDESTNVKRAVSILETIISAEHLKHLLDKQRKHIIFLDAFDELKEENKHSILNLVKILKHSKNYLKILVSSRARCKQELKQSLQVEEMDVVPLDEIDRRDFLRKFWKAKEDTKFNTFSEHLLDKFERDAPRADIDFIGLPLTMKMLAEVFQSKFEEYLECTTTVEPRSLLSNISVNIIYLYEQFTAKAILLTINKKWRIDINAKSFSREFKPQTETTFQNYQLLAMEQMKLDRWITDAQKAKLKKFRENIRDELEESLLLETVNGEPRFAHLSYAEFFCAKYLYDQLNNGRAESAKHLEIIIAKEFEVILRFFLKILDTKLSPTEPKPSLEIDKIVEILKTELKHIELRACKYNCANVLSRVLTADMLRSTEYSDKYTKNVSLLHVAAGQNACEAMKVLLEAGANLDVESWNETPLATACDEGHLDMVKLLVGKGANVNHRMYEKKSPLHVAIRFGHLKIIEYLVSDAAHINPAYKENKNIALLYAAIDDLDIVKMLISKGASIDYRDSQQRTVLHWAASRNKIEILTELLERGANMNAQDTDGETPLHHAVREYNFEATQLLLKRGATIDVANIKSQPVLHFAAFLGLLPIVEDRLNSGANVNEQDDEEQTPLYAAVAGRQLEVVRLLIARGADVNGFHPRWKETALHEAARTGQMAVVEVLCERGAKCDAQDFVECSPLHLAAEKDHSEVVRILIAKGAAINLLNKYEETALHIAAWNNETEVAKELLKGGADINMKNKDGDTPLSLATSWGHTDMVRLLEAHRDMHQHASD